MIKLLIADDSAVMRKFLSEIFRVEGDFDIHIARDGAEALEMAKKIAPDVITLDVNMPQMDGITCLSRIMVECPKPVIMVSSLTSRDAEVTVRALGLGAVDFIPKPDGTVTLNIDKIRPMLIAKVRAAARSRPRLSVVLARPPAASPAPNGAFHKPASPTPGAPIREVRGIVLIGVSTGGPGALETIIPNLPRELPWPVVICQHMPETFTGVFARRIDSISRLTVCEVGQPTPIQAGFAYVARGEADLLFGRRNGVLCALPTQSDSSYWHPSVTRMVRSAREHMPAAKLLGVMLTGMGDDGAAAMAELKEAGGRTIAEAEETAVVWGMPGELVKRGGASTVLQVQRIAEQIRRWAGSYQGS